MNLKGKHEKRGKRVERRGLFKNAKNVGFGFEKKVMEKRLDEF